MARRVGIFGGAFDPPHVGHLVVAAEARWQLGLDEVRLVPVGTPVHRTPPRADGETRFEMVADAVARHEGLVASRVELDLGGPSYTIQTLRALHAAEPDVEWTLIVGADQVLTFDSWREPVEIVGLARLGVVARDGVDPQSLESAAQTHAAGRFDVISIPRVDVSSTLIREQIAAGGPFSHLVEATVARRVEALGLYRQPDALR